ncbi:peptidoglycan-binding protein [Streptomyces sp. M2CJ-2]|uniref:peptidoglycan-binding protein n=1 Tax=Streptomyces sp. M2CJ-2 TaxID=2803948 RepID=UPI0019229D63|nr:peptidoglycan-binding protein [Streptomyces sp. M2CJ-2]MBL3665162.1 peptidoglycan-binding protein [Streptomyces sp. M2CJ-2]
MRDDTSGGRRRPTFDNRWLLLAALAVLLLLGRWYAPTAADGDAPVAERSATPQERPYDSESTASVPAPDEKIRPEPDPGGEGDAEREERFGGVGVERETPPGPPAARPSQGSTSRASGNPSVEASPPAEPEPAKTTAPAPGSAGRANCHYSSDRTRTFAKGMVGSEVKEIQCLLNSNYHFTLDTDGKFGTATDTAVRAVQRCSVLTVDGQVGPRTWKYLDTPKSGCGN